ncbi:MAG: hypothetical protein KAT68_07915 [Bacteroidales bacterium]|nr:hypothetical protein [Bacteroidales bacterium]
MRTFKKFIGISIAVLCFTLTSYSQDKPKATYRVGNSKVTVWENEREGKYGKFIVKDFQVEKVYKKGEEWKTTNLFNLTELLQLRAAIDKAINEEGVKIKEGDKEENKQKRE